MTIAMLAFATTDLFIIFALRDMNLAQILVLFGSGGAVIFGVVAHIQGHRWLSPTLLMRPVIIRNLAEIFATLMFLTALSLIPLSTLSAVIQANPLLVTLGAAVFLREAVGWRRWVAILIGLLGVLVIVQPGANGFDPNILFAVAATIGLSLRDLATRPVPKEVPTTLLSSYSFASVAVAGLVLLPFTGGFAPFGLVPGTMIGAAILVGLLAYFAITAAMRIGDIAAVTPFRYSRLVFGFCFAVIFLGEDIDATTLIGVAIVVATGLYTIWREGHTQPSNGKG